MHVSQDTIITEELYKYYEQDGITLSICMCIPEINYYYYYKIDNNMFSYSFFYLMNFCWLFLNLIIFNYWFFILNMFYAHNFSNTNHDLHQ